MSAISWMVYGQRSERTYVSDPNGDTARIAEALDRLDSAPPPKRGLFGRKTPATDDAVEAEKHVVRVAQPGVVEAVHAILTADPTQDQRVHDLAWRISATEDVDDDPDAAAAVDELFELEEQLDPES
ncbi:hypothetical protein [Promicromonospora sp. NPDC023987]|uniref:hypothetical protein n=1 Tax=Promicromonospora sp. NPDC023987 TaxID=3155360 RepID=UPI0033E8873D